MPDLPSHIPFGAQDKTEYIRALGVTSSDWYAFDGKVYSSNPLSVWNGTDWLGFVYAIHLQVNV
jgi:hypothetical protein